MNIFSSRLLFINVVIVLIFSVFFAGTCNSALKKIEKEKAEKAAADKRTKGLIKTILGIKYTEIHRKFDNGLSFSPVGYQLVPEWRISFPTVDSVNIYSPRKGRFLNAPVVFDHDSIFNVAWAWLRLNYLRKDSIQFQVLHVTNNIIDDEKVHVYMTMYSNDYIKNVLHSDTDQLRKPTSKDTAYIRAKVLLANKYPDSAFAGTTPVVLTSKSPLVTISKKKVPLDDVNGDKSYDEYLSPTYNIFIHKAYQDFSYEYTAFVDETGKITFRKSLVASYPEFRESTNAILKGITDGYLKLYLNVSSASTLGIKHTSIIFLNVQGFKK